MSTGDRRHRVNHPGIARVSGLPRLLRIAVRGTFGLKGIVSSVLPAHQQNRHRIRPFRIKGFGRTYLISIRIRPRDAAEECDVKLDLAERNKSREQEGQDDINQLLFSDCIASDDPGPKEPSN